MELIWILFLIIAAFATLKYMDFDDDDDKAPRDLWHGEE